MATSFDARQAKRLFPLLTSAAIVGSLAGFLSAIVIQRIVETRHLILAEAVLFVVAAGLLTGSGRGPSLDARLATPHRSDGPHRGCVVRGPLPAHAPRGRRVRPAGGPDVQPHVPLHDRHERRLPRRAGPADRAGALLGSGDARVVPDGHAHRQSTLCAARFGHSGAGAADHVPGRLRPLDHAIHADHHDHRALRPAGHPTRLSPTRPSAPSTRSSRQRDVDRCSPSWTACPDRRAR